jgi:hypothetical protein
LFTSELARRLHGSGVTAHSFDPGLVASGFNRNNGLLINLAMTMLWASVAERGEGGDVAGVKGATYCIYRLFGFGADHEIYKVFGPLETFLALEPIVYRARVRTRA